MSGLFYARFDRDGLSIQVHELNDGTYMVSRRDRGALPSGRTEMTFKERKRALAEALAIIDEYT